MKIAVACDHGGLVLKTALLRYLADNGYEAVDFGTDCADSCDYPDYALPAAARWRSIFSAARSKNEKSNS